MKNRYLVAAISLSIGAYSINLGSETPTSSVASGSLISWTQSSLYNIYQGMVDSFTGLINIPSSIIHTVAAWSDQKKMFVATAAIASLLVIYQKEGIKQWLNDVVERLTLSEKTRRSLRSVNVEEIPWDENYGKRVRKALQ